MAFQVRYLYPPTSDEHSKSVDTGWCNPGMPNELLMNIVSMKNHAPCFYGVLCYDRYSSVPNPIAQGFCSDGTTIKGDAFIVRAL